MGLPLAPRKLELESVHPERKSTLLMLKGGLLYYENNLSTGCYNCLGYKCQLLLSLPLIHDPSQKM